MRLWHYKLIPYLPKSQLLAQWRELNSIFKNQPRHILINYVYEYNGYGDLYQYSLLVIREMEKRGIEIKTMINFYNFFGFSPSSFAQHSAHYFLILDNLTPFPNHHDDRYLLQCFYNLQEKYDRGQKDFRYGVYLDLEDFIKRVVFNEKTCRV